jgi:hypothetical protein
LPFTWLPVGGLVELVDEKPGSSVVCVTGHWRFQGRNSLLKSLRNTIADTVLRSRARLGATSYAPIGLCAGGLILRPSCGSVVPAFLLGPRTRSCSVWHVPAEMGQHKNGSYPAFPPCAGGPLSLPRQQSQARIHTAWRSGCATARVRFA